MYVSMIIYSSSISYCIDFDFIGRFLSVLFDSNGLGGGCGGGGDVVGVVCGGDCRQKRFQCTFQGEFDGAPIGISESGIYFIGLQLKSKEI